MADASVASSAAGGFHLLQDARPLRDSALWALQTAYYARAGVACWADAVVPNFVTSNAFVAATYARVVLSYIRDWYK